MRALAKEPLKAPHYGPYHAEVLRVIDGDTFAARVWIWPLLQTELHIRLRGIDAPELRGASCPAARRTAEAARDVLAMLLAEADMVILDAVEPDPYPGRMLATVMVPPIGDVGAEMVRQGLAVDWGTEGGWCG